MSKITLQYDYQFYGNCEEATRYSQKENSALAFIEFICAIFTIIAFCGFCGTSYHYIMDIIKEGFTYSFFCDYLGISLLIALCAILDIFAYYVGKNYIEYRANKICINHEYIIGNITFNQKNEFDKEEKRKYIHSFKFAAMLLLIICGILLVLGLLLTGIALIVRSF